MANKLYSQYRDKTKAEAVAQIPADFREQINDAVKAVRDMWDIDNNSGAQLDIIGDIVAQDKDYIVQKTLTVYQCNSDGDNQCGDESIQCSAPSILADSELTDDYYRLLIKSKIAINNSDATIDDILDAINAINLIAPDIDVLRLTDGEDMTFSIEFYGLADPVVRDLLINGAIIPTPQGVLFNGFLEGINMVECNSEGFYQCGDETAQCVGFIGV